MARNQEIDTGQRVLLASQVFGTYGALIRAIIDQSVEDRPTADDIYQDVFLSIVNNPVPSEANVEAYLYRLVTNDIVDEARRRENHRDHIARYRQCCDRKTECQSHEMTLIQFEQTQEMVNLMSGLLKRTEARALTRRYFHGEDVTEGAEAMGVKKETFSHYLCAGLARIKEYFAQCEATIQSIS